jgi:mono/diheme cytochrome c family protein
MIHLLARGLPARAAILAIMLAAALDIAASAAALAADRLGARGRSVLMRLCSDCHAVGRTGRSPHVLAPPFRDIGQRYDIDDLVERLRTGFTAPHPDMPTFSLTPADAQAVKAYLYDIQK